MGTRMAMFDTESDAKPPLGAHPAFPAIVALWFAALLGFGSLILPDVLVERLVAASGIGSLVPSANPPLGWTAHSLIAVFAGASGALAGLAIARQVARAHAATGDWDDDAFTITRQGPLNIHDEVDAATIINGHGLPVTNRRALAIAEDADDDSLHAAPLSGEDREDPVVEDPVFDPKPQDGGQGLEVARSRDDEWQLDRESRNEPKVASAEEPGMVELAQRLGTSLQKRREWLAQAQAVSDALRGRTPLAGLDAAAPEDAARATAAYFDAAEKAAFARSSGASATAPARPDADAALRDALATIRRITGAA